VVSYVFYQPPSGWSVTSLTPRGNAVDIAIHNNASTPTSSPLDLGTALFQPNQDQPATTWVELPRFVLKAGGQNIGLCVSGDEDNHWSVTSLGAQSVVTDAPAIVETLSIYPNPSEGNVWVNASSDVGAVTIEVYDMIGQERSVIQASIQEDNPTQVTLPDADGVYNILIRSGAETRMLRVVREH
jgi:hypothetical protein